MSINYSGTPADKLKARLDHLREWEKAHCLTAGEIEEVEHIKSLLAQGQPTMPRENFVNRTEYNAELIDFAMTIDFAELFQHIKAITGVSCDFTQPEVSTPRNYKVRIDFTSSDIASQTGPFAAVLETCVLCSWGCGAMYDEQNKPYYWVSVRFHYAYKIGGSNGTFLTSAMYTKRDGWSFSV